MSQVITQSLPDTQTPKSVACENSKEDFVEIWGRLLPQRPFLQNMGCDNYLDLTKEAYVLGRKETCDICISAKNMYPNLVTIISKEHFRVSRDSTFVPYIEDLSRNGTFLNGGLIGKGNMSTLCTGDIIAVGNAKIEVYLFRDESNCCNEFNKKYKETRVLGRGAFGEVTLAFSLKTCHRFAVKKIPKNRLAYGQIKSNDEKIRNEVKILRALEHPCVIHLEEIIYTNELVYIVLEYIEGGELYKRVIKNRNLSESVTKLFFYQMTLAVQYLHSQGITHRDLKPENILLVSDDEMTLIKVTDFGLSKFIDNDSVLKSLCGTPMYVAPEILRNNGMGGSYTPNVDIWSLGVMLFFCLCGDPPFVFDIDDPKSFYFQILEGRYTLPLEVKNNISRNAIDILQNTLITDPKKRITLEGLLKHEWMQDSNMLSTFDKLLMKSNELTL